jgi:excisionase family DNA binding protein
VNEAAELLRVHRVTIARWIRAGDLRVMRPGPHSLRVPRAELERLLAGEGQASP